MKKIRIAIQKNGRLTNPSLQFLIKNLKDPDNNIPKLISCENKLQVEVSKNLELLFVRNSDIPRLLTNGAIDLAVTGLNTIIESDYRGEIISELNFAYCRLSLAVEKSKKIASLSDFNNKKIATSFPNSTAAFFEKNKLNVEIVQLNGSVEIAPSIGISDAIVDLVCSGQTLAANNLKEIVTLYQSQAFLIGNSEFATQIFSSQLIKSQLVLAAAGQQ